MGDPVLTCEVSQEQLTRIERALASLSTEPLREGIDPGMREVRRRGLEAQAHALRRELATLEGSPNALPTHEPIDETSVV